MIGRLLRRCDFERVLATPPCSRSAHFAVHHVCACPSSGAEPKDKPRSEELSTQHAPLGAGSVDNLVAGHWLGQVVPKRLASRSVTRNLLRRQIRAAMQRHQTELRPGLWLVRLRQPFSAASYRAADSRALRRDAAAELDRLLSRAAR